MSLLEKLGKSLLFFDGPLGSMVSVRHSGVLPELLVLDPEGVAELEALYRTYLDCGVDIVTADTFAANRQHLERVGHLRSVAEINRRAVDIARNAVGGRAFVAASVGPLDAPGSMAEAELEAIYAEQMDSLAEVQPDLLHLETFSAPREAAAALRAAARTGIPFSFSLNGMRFSRQPSRPAALRMANVAAEQGACMVGVNCAAPFLVGELAALLLENIPLPIVASPNAGAPELHRGRITYRLNTAALLAEAEQWHRSGIAAIGGCCGIVPEQLRALSTAFRGRPVAPRTVVSAPPSIVSAPPEIPENDLRTLLRSGRRLMALELRFPPQGNYAETLALAGELGSDPGVLFTVPDCPTGNPGCDPLAAAALLRKHCASPIVLHQAAGNANLGKVYGQLFGAWELGARGVLAISGDSPTLGPFGRLTSRVGDLANSLELLRLLHLLGSGYLLNEQPLKKALPFVSACAFSPGGNPEGAANWLRQKVAAGAEAVFTQPIFTVGQLKEHCKTLDWLREARVALFVGVLPLSSAAQARRLGDGMIPGLVVPEEAMERMAAEDTPEAGLKLAAELLEAIAGAGHHAYLVPPFSRDKSEAVRILHRAWSACGQHKNI